MAFASSKARFFSDIVASTVSTSLNASHSSLFFFAAASFAVLVVCRLWSAQYAFFVELVLTINCMLCITCKYYGCNSVVKVNVLNISKRLTLKVSGGQKINALTLFVVHQATVENCTDSYILKLRHAHITSLRWFFCEPNAFECITNLFAEDYLFW